MSRRTTKKAKAARYRAWVEANRQRRREYAAAWRAKNRNHIRTWNKAWRDRKKRHLKRYHKRKYWENPEKKRADKRLDHHRHKASRNAASRRRYNAVKHTKSYQRKSKAYYVKHREKILLYARRIYDENNYDGRREQLREAVGHRCQVCGAEPNGVWHLNTHHIDRNRANNLAENLLILCPSCHALVHYYEDKID